MVQTSLFRNVMRSFSGRDYARDTLKFAHHVHADELNWAHSQQYSTVVGEGHHLPPPSFGAPTLVWHFGIWESGNLDDDKYRSGDKSHTKSNSFERQLQTVIEKVDARNYRLFSELSDFLAALQERGRVRGAPIERLRFDAPQIDGGPRNRADGTEEPHNFKVCEPQSLGFTLWWQDSGGDGHLNERQEQPSSNDLRVRVQAQTYLEHATISFYIDVGKPWSATAINHSVQATGSRRKSILERLEHVRSICDGQIRDGHVDLELVPEHVDSPDDAALLLETADYLYDGIWREFLSAFGLRSWERRERKDAKFEGEVFADFRGLVHSAAGIRTLESERRDEIASRIRESLSLAPQLLTQKGGSASVGIGRVEIFDNESGEPNTILKSYWPFVRRMTPGADQRDFVGCGILEWRCLYITALGSAADGLTLDESMDTSWEVPQGSLPKVHAPADHASEPIRYLLITKGQPHRHQIGRFVERINATGTMRLFALKHWPTIRNAGVHIRVLGRELDGILSYWSANRVLIDNDTDQELGPKYKNSRATRRRSRKHQIDPLSVQMIKDERLRRLNSLISDTEAKLIALGAKLDNIGRGGSGRLLYSIDRSKYFIDEFERMAPTLEIGNIDGWINHNQFVERGLKPTFDQLKNTGANLVALRGRLRMITEMIQTSALIVEAEATSGNTEVLRQIASNWFWAKYGLLALIATNFLELWSSGKLASILAWTQRVLGPALIRFLGISL